MKYWLIKSEPECYSYEDLTMTPGHEEPWDGVRNYQARNYMRAMKKGDRILYYHSNCQPPHVAGIAEVTRESYPDSTAWDPESEHPDVRSTPEKPLWDMVDIRGVRPLEQKVTLSDIKADPSLQGMKLVQKGNRLSVMPVEQEEYERICAMGRVNGS